MGGAEPLLKPKGKRRRRRKAEKAEMQLLFCPAAERRPEAQTGPGQSALASPHKIYSILRGPRGEGGPEMVLPARAGVYGVPGEKSFAGANAPYPRKESGVREGGILPSLALMSDGNRRGKESLVSPGIAFLLSRWAWRVRKTTFLVCTFARVLPSAFSGFAGAMKKQPGPS